MQMRWMLLSLALCLGSCTAATAPDSAVCADLIHRLCLAPRCSDVDPTLLTDDTCEQELLTRTGCGTDTFAFGVVSRDEFLSCRAPLLSAGADWDSHPDCTDVTALFQNCPDVVTFLGGTPQ